jgi:hypothetical protein
MFPHFLAVIEPHLIMPPSQYPAHSESSPSALNPPFQSLFDVVYCMAQQMANSVMMLRMEWASQF